MQPLGHERAWLEANPLKRILWRLFGWRQPGPWLRFWHIERALRAKTFTHILEAGCGCGQNLFALARRFPQAHLVGVDVDPEAVALAQRIAAHMPASRPQFLLSDLQHMALKGSFDLIFMVNVLEYIPDDAGVLRACVALLQSEGLFVLHVPKRVALQHTCLGVAHTTVGHARQEYTQDEIRKKIEAAGLSIQRLWETDGPLATLSWELFRLAEKIPGLALIGFPFFLLLMRVDWWLNPKQGNGYLIVAERLR